MNSAWRSYGQKKPLTHDVYETRKLDGVWPGLEDSWLTQMGIQVHFRVGSIFARGAT